MKINIDAGFQPGDSNCSFIKATIEIDPLQELEYFRKNDMDTFKKLIHLIQIVASKTTRDIQI